MASRLGRRVLLQLSRPSLRVNAQNAGRRSMSSTAHSAEKSSDKPWIIASTLVFGSAAVYLVSPSAKAKAHDATEHSLPKKVPTPATPLPVKDDEGTEVPAEEVESSVQAAVEEDSPKDAQAAEEKTEPSEGEAAPADAAPEEIKGEAAPDEPSGESVSAPAITEQSEKPSEDAPAGESKEAPLKEDH